MAGLVLKEVKQRGLVNRVLIVVPGHLRDQWIREMKEKFGETFRVVDRLSHARVLGEFPEHIATYSCLTSSGRPVEESGPRPPSLNNGPQA